jgi:hypothetical protein
VSLRLAEVLGGADRSQHFAVGDHHRGGFAIDRQEPRRPWLCRVGDVHQPDAHLFTIGVGQQAAVGADGYDLGHRFLADVAPGGDIAVRLERGNAGEVFSGAGCAGLGEGEGERLQLGDQQGGDECGFGAVHG